MSSSSNSVDNYEDLSEQGIEGVSSWGANMEEEANKQHEEQQIQQEEQETEQGDGGDGGDRGAEQTGEGEDILMESSSEMDMLGGGRGVSEEQRRYGELELESYGNLEDEGSNTDLVSNSAGLDFAAGVDGMDDVLLGVVDEQSAEAGYAAGAETESGETAEAGNLGLEGEEDREQSELSEQRKTVEEESVLQQSLDEDDVASFSEESRQQEKAVDDGISDALPKESMGEEMDMGHKEQTGTVDDIKEEFEAINKNDAKAEDEDDNEMDTIRESNKAQSKGEEAEPEYVVPQTHEIVIPSYAKWFHLNKIHEIEKKSLPEFFINRIPSKTPQVYVKYRNFMVNSYRLNPNEYFTFTSARRNLCGDAGSIFRVHKFLSKWGLINYQVDSKLKPKAVEPPFTGEYATRHDAPRGLFPFQSYKPAVQIPDMSRLKKMMTQLKDPVLHVDEESQSELKIEDDQDKLTNGKRLSNGTAGSSFKPPKKPRLEDMIDKNWTKEEVLKLLKSLQQYGADWLQVSKDVGNKTPEQCILRFLQLPIEDNFLDDQETLGPLKYGAHLPFSKADNPVMSTLAFLIGLVDPKTIQSMTQRAIKMVGDNEIDSKRDPDETIASTVKEATEVAVSTLGFRSHVFASNEERQINSITNELINTQLKKVDLKLKLLDTMEKSLEMERKALQKQQEEVFVQKFSFSRHVANMLEKFDNILNEYPDPDRLREHMESLKKMVTNPPTFSIGPTSDQTPGSASNGPNQTPLTAANEASVTSFDESHVKPVSMDAPQLYRYWSG
ncbi:Swi3p Ecym_8116 [Eremothecium cymbalariae DBVPG|uniref:SWIRM domain-containing protein n=1 Tax=Eremothecium cymbalariae (strain CBS 270.75 / DBVPG 7215 / KCTC 17166 / NRRL Y-17582) TaxID=931890 RepID=G8JX36_ERECY|nr:Hypothetical protein Ecym_8116 [Eremothecium cymbalariae DBVPG\